MKTPTPMLCNRWQQLVQSLLFRRAEHTVDQALEELHDARRRTDTAAEKWEKTLRELRGVNGTNGKAGGR